MKLEKILGELKKIGQDQPSMNATNLKNNQDVEHWDISQALKSEVKI